MRNSPANFQGTSVPLTSSGSSFVSSLYGYAAKSNFAFKSISNLSLTLPPHVSPA